MDEEVGNGRVSVESVKKAAVAAQGVLGRSKTSPLENAGRAFRKEGELQRLQDRPLVVCSSRSEGQKGDSGLIKAETMTLKHVLLSGVLTTVVALLLLNLVLPQDVKAAKPKPEENYWWYSCTDCSGGCLEDNCSHLFWSPANRICNSAERRGEGVICYFRVEGATGVTEAEICNTCGY